MALNASGTLSLGGTTVGQSINLELGRAATATAAMHDNALRTLAGVPSGQISISNFYGKSNITTHVLFVGGFNVQNRTVRYGYTTYASDISTNLTYSHGGRCHGTSTSTIGYVMGGRGSGAISATTKFTYASKTVAAGGNLNSPRVDGASFGNATLGILTNGYTDTYGTATTTSSAYTYSTNTCASTTAINTGYSGNTDMPTAASISTLGYIAFGWGGTPASRRWTFSNATVATGTTLGTVDNGCAGQVTSTTTNAYFQSQSTSKIYNYAGNSVSAMTAFAQTFGPRTAGGNGTIGVYGNIYGQTGVRIYTYSGGAISNGSALAATLDDWGACSNPPGSF